MGAVVLTLSSNTIFYSSSGRFVNILVAAKAIQTLKVAAKNHL
jgi:ribosomal protein L28